MNCYQKNKLKGLKLVSLNIASLLKHLDELRIFVEEEKPHIIGINETRLDNMMTPKLKLMVMRSCAGIVTEMVVVLLYMYIKA